MQFIRNAEAQAWCRAAPRSFTLHEELIPSYDGRVTHAAKYDVPDRYEDIARLLHQLLTIPGEFEGGLAWLLNWWSDKESETITLKIIEGVRRGHGETRTLEDVPACLFDSSEIQDAIALLIHPVLNTWAAQFVSVSARFVLRSTVSGYLYLIARDKEHLDKVLESTAAWKPRQEIPGMFRTDR